MNKAHHDCLRCDRSIVRAGQGPPRQWLRAEHLPRGFAGPYSRDQLDGWLPFGPALNGRTDAGRTAPRASVNVFGRVRKDVSFADAARLATAAAAIPRAPDWRGHIGDRLSVMSLTDQTLDDIRGPLEALLAAVVFVLLIACANVASLQLERVFGRRRELAVRMAIGATRSRVIGQTLTENVTLYILGGAGGLLVARWTLPATVGLLALSVPHLHDIQLNGAVLRQRWSSRALPASPSVSCPRDWRPRSH